MSSTDLAGGLARAWREMSPWELYGTLASLACVLLTMRRNIWCWPVGIVGIALFFVMFWQARLYAELITQIVFFILSLYGWWQWIRLGPDRRPLVVGRASRIAVIGSAILLALGTPALGWWMAGRGAAAPYWDSTITVLSLLAQWMLARKWLESWALWIAVDLLAAPLYWSRGLYLASILYVVFLGLAIAGFLEWRRAWMRARPA